MGCMGVHGEVGWARGGRAGIGGVGEAERDASVIAGDESTCVGVKG